MRVSIKEFSIANPAYRGASVYAYTVAAGVKTATLATLYSATTGVSQLTNPQRLDSTGKWVQPVYIEVPVVLTISGMSMPSHDTGVIFDDFWLGKFGVSVNGDEAKTLTVGTDKVVQAWILPLTVARAVTLSTTGAYEGARFRIVRNASATGAFNLNVGTGPLKSLALGTWCEVDYFSGAWYLSAYGAL